MHTHLRTQRKINADELDNDFMLENSLSFNTFRHVTLRNIANSQDLGITIYVALFIIEKLWKLWRTLETVRFISQLR